MAHEEKDAPGVATPGATVSLNSENLYTADEIDSLLSEINRDIPRLRIRSVRQLKASDRNGNLTQGFINKSYKRLYGLLAIGVLAVALFAEFFNRPKQATGIRSSNCS
ncbi:hypothetical protein GWO63_010055 [Corynebacterium macginleyi]|uniref:DUF3618 domain-containing protein n=1 Tax=Corynebacterium macginleyi TaxID=38290 RepID=A0ABS1Y869_9CORY|nr:hypothetical protein [Corynebacterium macginleyi]MBM0244570.1 hypothetical protein [Corynebacterium macginleyi]